MLIQKTALKRNFKVSRLGFCWPRHNLKGIFMDSTISVMMIDLIKRLDIVVGKSVMAKLESILERSKSIEILILKWVDLFKHLSLYCYIWETFGIWLKYQFWKQTKSYLTRFFCFGYICLHFDDGSSIYCSKFKKIYNK